MWKPVTLSLVVDKFVFNYVRKQYDKHIIACIKNIIQYQ